MTRLRRAAVIIVGIFIFIAGLNLGVPAISRLVRYSIYASPLMREGMPLAGAAPSSPAFGLAVNSFLGLVLAVAGVALVRRQG